MNKNFQVDTTVVILLTFLSLICISTPSLNKIGAVTVLYVILLFFLPGYSILTALSPKMGRIKKPLASIPLSVIIVLLISSAPKYLKIYFKMTLLILVILVTVFALIGLLRRIKSSKAPEGKYITCEDCGGYYQLEKGESLDDFGACHCGGALKYAEKDFLSKKSTPKRRKFWGSAKKSSKKSEAVNSKYLMCENCGGHYKLGEGESLEDFETCHCGGELKYAKSYFKPKTLKNQTQPRSDKFSSKRGSTFKKFLKLNKSHTEPLKIKNAGINLPDKDSLFKFPDKGSKFMPTDILAVWLITALCVIFVLVPVLNETFLKVIPGTLLALFAPGYALIAALFPKNDDLDIIERTALSFGLSIAVSSLIGLMMNYTPFAVQLTPILISISAFTILMGIIAYIRRFKLPDNERLNIEFKKHYERAVNSFKTESGTSKLLSIVLVASIILAVSGTVYVVATPKEGEKFTEFYILGPNGKASDYPANLTAGERGNVTLGVVNHEYAGVNYKVVVKFNNYTLNETNITLASDEKYEGTYTFTPSSSRQNQKVEFLLYKLPDENIPYRSLHLWINKGEEF